MHAEGLLGYKIYPSEKTYSYFLPVTYVAPFSSINRKALGFDISSERLRRETIFDAIERQDATLSPKLELMIDDSEKRGFNLYLPLFKSTFAKNTSNIERIEGMLFASIKSTLLSHLQIPANNQ